MTAATPPQWGRRAVLGAAVLGLLTGCGSGAGSTPGTAPAPRRGPAPLPPSPGSPFTGLPVDEDGPVLAVKIDNVARARPQTGIAAADLVYVQPVEGGLTRLLAVFQSAIPPVVGPVRSLRQTDLQLLSCLGAPALAFSGEAPELRPMLDRAPVVDVSAFMAPGAYFRDPLRPRPHNFYVRAGDLRAGRPPRDIGFRFGPVPRDGRAQARAVARYPSTGIDVEWVASERRWVFGVDGAPLLDTDGGRPGAGTVVLQRVRVRETAIRDVTGALSPFAESVGAGEALVLRDGQAFDARWSRPSPDAGTTFTRPDGTALPFATGPVWVLLLPGTVGG